MFNKDQKITQCPETKKDYNICLTAVNQEVGYIIILKTFIYLHNKEGR